MSMKMDLKFLLVTDKLFISLSEPSVLQYVNKVKRNGLNPRGCQIWLYKGSGSQQ